MSWKKFLSRQIFIEEFNQAPETLSEKYFEYALSGVVESQAEVSELIAQG